MALNIADLIEHCIDLVPERVALESGERSRTYAELEDRSNRLAHHLLAQGVQPGDKVGLYSRNTIECVEAMVAIFKARAVMVNVNFRYAEPELEYLFTNSDMVALIHERQYTDKVAAVASRCPRLRSFVAVEDGSSADLTALGALELEAALGQASPERDFGERSGEDIYMIYTGGTTGMPKGVMWRQEDVWRVLGGGISFLTGEHLADEWEQARTGAESPQATRFPIPPFIHGGSQWAVLQSLFTGGKAVVYPDFDGERTWQIVEKHQVNVLFITGDAMARPMMDGLLSGRYDTSSVVALTSTAALFSPSVKRQYLEALPHAFITDSIGSSETGFSGMGVVSADTAGSAGPVVKIDSSTQVLDEHGVPVQPGSGQIGMLARSGYLPLGYYNDPVKTAETFRELNGVRYSIPGDYARVEADGTVTMLGRGSVSINTGGEKVFPEEVEGALKSHPAVLDALVVGVPDERMGTAVAAVVARRPGVSVTLAELDAHVRTMIAGYKVPRALWFADEIRRSPAGKPDYRWARTLTEADESAHRSAPASPTSAHRASS
ncbi:acyl-CoA synthetase [Rhodococcus sp. X156]|uniref:acyl-CoA synthetase n=1 Tax=Rhodococcus sp. X156 TaxID=2499145 RepID=UPI000FDC5436|nr:acyl-CoA synthetase [Rhodococcus sp. X156]